MASAPPQTVVGNFAIERELAAGGMGVVYIAQHTLTEARVALKLMRPEVAKDEASTERFLREVKAAARIGHDGIVKVFDAGRTPQGQLYLAMELLQGETLDAHIARGGHSRMALLQHIVELLEPLSAAHAAGIVHRDLKPENVFLAVNSSGATQVKLLDFGIARDASGKSVTATGMALGTPHYMSPEQCTAPSTAGAQADVWSVGVMLYEVLCDVMPFDGETLHAVLLQVSMQPHPPIAERAPWVNAALADLVDRCLRKDAAERPADASALRRELLDVLTDEGLSRALDGSMTPPAPDAARLSATAATALSPGADLGSAPTQASLVSDRPASAPATAQAPMQADASTATQQDTLPVQRGRGVLIALAVAAIGALAYSAFSAWPTTPSIEEAAGDAASVPQGPVKRAPPSPREIRATAILPDPEPPPEQPADDEARADEARADGTPAADPKAANDDRAEGEGEGADPAQTAEQRKREERRRRRRERREAEAQPQQQSQPAAEATPQAVPKTQPAPTSAPVAPTPAPPTPAPTPAPTVAAPAPVPAAPAPAPKPVPKRKKAKKRPDPFVTF